MSSKVTTSIAVTDEIRLHIAAIHEIARLHGVDLSYSQTSGGGEVGRDLVRGAPAPSNAAAIRWALAVLAGSTPAPKRDAYRVRSLRRAGWSTAQIARAAGVTRGHVRAVLSGSVPLSPVGLLHAWVAEQEAAR